MGFIMVVILSTLIALIVDAYKEEIKTFFRGIFERKDKWKYSLKNGGLMFLFVKNVMELGNLLSLAKYGGKENRLMFVRNATEEELDDTIKWTTYSRIRRANRSSC